MFSTEYDKGRAEMSAASVTYYAAKAAHEKGLIDAAAFADATQAFDVADLKMEEVARVHGEAAFYPRGPEPFEHECTAETRVYRLRRIDSF